MHQGGELQLYRIVECRLEGFFKYAGVTQAANGSCFVNRCESFAGSNPVSGSKKMFSKFLFLNVN